MKKRSLFLKVIFIFAAIFSVFLLFYLNFVAKDEIDLSTLQPGRSSVTKIYTFPRNDGIIDVSNAKEISNQRIFYENSEWCSYYEMPQNLINAFIAVEDHRFYEHSGIDWLRTSKATLNYFFKFDKSGYGGSTITQQLIKNLTGYNNVTPKRKIKEAIRAINIEKELSKNEILELYLNIVYLSENCYGVQSASKLYFGKNPKDLTLAECAALASIVKNPAKYDPYKFPENNRLRRKIVLKEMLDNGMISSESYERAIEENVNINKNIDSEKSSGIYSWYTEKLIADVSRDLMNKYNLTKEGALMMIYKGGLNIYSTIDLNVQNSVDKAFQNYIAYLKPEADYGYPEASCVVLDPNTSDILAICGGVGNKKTNRILNRATDSKRPLGSVIKPLSVYAPGIEKGIITYASVYDDVPEEKDGVFWPHNSNNIYRGLVSVNFALEKSINTVAVKALKDIGLRDSFNFAKNKFKLSLLEEDMNFAPLALGQLTEGDTLLNVTNAYTAFANGGYIGEPRSYYYVTDSSGKVLLSNDYYGEKIISEDTASIMNIMLKNVVEKGTAKNLKLKNNMNVAGKTGTSGDNMDKWFVGYTPYYVCGVWVGYDYPKPMNSNTNSAINLFDAVMIDAHQNKSNKPLLVESNNIVKKEFCADSGKIPSENCRLDPRLNRIQVGYFKKGSEPTEQCDIHKDVIISSQSGKIVKNENSIFTR